jgi:CDP-diacylglycerol--serine O-phosphatidyltransferase
VLLYFVGCGVSRLARFNVTAATLSDNTGKVKYFEGTPIPTSLALVLVLAILFWKGRTGDALPFGVWNVGPFQLHPLVLMYFASGSAMISKTLRIPKF